MWILQSQIMNCRMRKDRRQEGDKRPKKEKKTTGEADPEGGLFGIRRRGGERKKEGKLRYTSRKGGEEEEGEERWSKGTKG